MRQAACILTALIVSLGISEGQLIVYNGVSRIIFGQKGLQDALDDTTVSSIRVSGTVALNGDWHAPPIITNRTVLIEGDPNNVTNGISFGGVLAALVVGEGAQVTFHNISLEDAGPQNTTEKNVTQRVRSLSLWPSLILLDGASVTFENTTLQYYSQQSWSRCQYFAQKVLYQLQVTGVGKNLSSPNNVTIQVHGTNTTPDNVTDITTNKPVGQVSITTSNSTLICVDDPFAQDGAISGVPASQSKKGGGGFKWWYGLLIGLGSAAVLCLLAAGAFILLRRQRRRSRSRQSSIGQSLPSSKENDHQYTNGSSIVEPRSLPSDISLQPSEAIPTRVTADSALIHATGSDIAIPPKLNGFGSVNSVRSSPSQIGSYLGSSPPAGMMTPGSLMQTKDSWGEVGLLLRERSNFSDLEFGPLIGTGSFGRVYKGRWKGAFVAIKIVDNKGAASKLIALREGMLSHSAQHPNVVTTYSVFTQQLPTASDAAWMQDTTDDGDTGRKDSRSMSRVASLEVAQSKPSITAEDHSSTVMVLEYADRGTLDKAMTTGRFVNKTTGELDLKAIHATLVDIAGGLAYLHSVGVLHGDLKGANVLLKSTTNDSRRFTAKLADFGMARLLAENSTHVSTQTYGTISYMPVEVLKYGKLTRKVDSYSFAILMWELFSGEILYADMTVAQLYYKVCCEHDKPSVPKNMPADYALLMQRCWNDDPELRPTAEEILQVLLEIRGSRRPSKDSQGQDAIKRLADLNRSSVASQARDLNRSSVASQARDLNRPSVASQARDVPSTIQTPRGASKVQVDHSPDIQPGIELKDSSVRVIRIPPQVAPSPFSAMESVKVNMNPTAVSVPATQIASRPSPSPFSQPVPSSASKLETDLVNNNVNENQQVTSVDTTNPEEAPATPAQESITNSGSRNNENKASVSKPPVNPFAAASMKFGRGEDSSSEPFGAVRSP